MLEDDDKVEKTVSDPQVRERMDQSKTVQMMTMPDVQGAGPTLSI